MVKMSCKKWHQKQYRLFKILIAQVKSENFYFLTVDEKILAYPYDFIIK